MQEMFLYIGKIWEMLDSQKKPFWHASKEWEQWSNWLHTSTNNIDSGKQHGFMSDPIEAKIRLVPPSQWRKFFMSVWQLIPAEKKIRVLSLLQQKMLVEASKVTFAGIELDTCTPQDAAKVEWLYNFFVQNEVDNLNEISFEDANVTYFVSGYIGLSSYRQRKCTDCKIL